MDNARIQYVELGKALNLSEAAVRKKVKKLVEKGAIQKFTIVVNPKKADMFVSYTGIDVYSEHLLEIIDSLKAIPEIKKIMLTSGDHDLMVEIVSDDLKKIKQIHEKIAKIKGVRRVCPSIVLDVLK